jgi:hypothetical protein
VLKRESSALWEVSQHEQSHPSLHVQSPDLQILPIHDNVIEPEENWEPEFNHIVILWQIGLRGCCSQGTFRAIEHDGDDAAQHGDCQQANFLIFADFAELRDADSEISKGTISDNGRKMVFVKSGNDLKCGTCNSFCGSGEIVPERGEMKTDLSIPSMRKKTLQTSFSSRIADSGHVLVSFDEDIARPCHCVNTVKLGKDGFHHIANLGIMVVGHGVFKRL